MHHWGKSNITEPNIDSSAEYPFNYIILLSYKWIHEILKGEMHFNVRSLFSNKLRDVEILETSENYFNAFYFINIIFKFVYFGFLYKKFNNQ